MMNTAQNFEFFGDYACFRPSGQVSFEEAIEIVAEGIEFANRYGVKRLLADTRNLTGFPSPGTFQRFTMANRWASISHGLRLAVIARPELIDPNRFGVTVASNRGLFANVFTSEPEAIAWLLEPTPKRSYFFDKLTE